MQVLSVAAERVNDKEGDEPHNDNLKYMIWPQCPGDWLRVNGIYLVSPSFERHFKELTQAN